MDKRQAPFVLTTHVPSMYSNILDIGTTWLCRCLVSPNKKKAMHTAKSCTNASKDSLEIQKLRVEPPRMLICPREDSS